jgi:hypothetical protein
MLSTPPEKSTPSSAVGQWEGAAAFTAVADWLCGAELAASGQWEATTAPWFSGKPLLCLLLMSPLLSQVCWDGVRVAQLCVCVTRHSTAASSAASSPSTAVVTASGSTPNSGSVVVRFPRVGTCAACAVGGKGVDVTEDNGGFSLHSGSSQSLSLIGS